MIDLGVNLQCQVGINSGTAIAGMIFGIIATVMMVVFLVAAAVFVYAYLSSPGWRY